MRRVTKEELAQYVRISQPLVRKEVRVTEWGRRLGHSEALGSKPYLIGLCSNSSPPRPWGGEQAGV